MNARKLTASYVRSLIPKRPSNSHKGKNGHVLLVAGSRGMSGAAYLAALGALKAGAGLVTVASDKTVLKMITTKLPEAMTLQLTGKAIERYVRWRTITTLAIGPGLSVGLGVGRAVKLCLGLRIPAVLDADGLNNITPKDILRKDVVITPHPGELGKLMGTSRNEIERDRLRITLETAKKLSVVCVLKGHHTVISDGLHTAINATGNPAMATGGMGDVLTGVIAAFLAEGLSRFDAACAGVFLHGLAGDIAKGSDRGLLASEVAAALPKALRKIGLK